MAGLITLLSTSIAWSPGITDIEWKRTSVPRVNYKSKNSLVILNRLSSGYKTKLTSVYIINLTDLDSSF